MHAARARRQHRSAVSPRSRRLVRRLGLTGSVIAASAAIAIAMLPLATPASAQGTTWTLTLGTPTGTTTTGFVANGTVTSDGFDGFVNVRYEPTGTPITTSSPTAGLVIFNSGETTPQPVSIPVDQLTPHTSYTYELEATEDDDDAMFFTSTGTITTTANPTGPTTPIDPPNNPTSNGIFGQCSGDAVCVNDINGVRATQEQLTPLSLPSNWSTLTGPEQMFVWSNLERTSRGEVAIPNLVNTYNSAVQTGLTDDADPSLSDLPGNSGSIWAGAYDTVLGAIYGWMYDDGPGGENSDCTTPTAPGCWGHRDNILADSGTFGNPTEMDAGVGTDSGGNADYDAIFVVNPNQTAQINIVFSWAQEQPFLSGSTNAPSVSGVTITGTVDAPTVTVTGSNFGSTAPTATPETCQPGDTGNDYGFGGLEFVDVSKGYGAGESGDCVGLLLTSWSSTKVVFTFGNEYLTYGAYLIPGDQFQVTVQGATYTGEAEFTQGAPTVTSISPGAGPTSGGTTVTITGTGFTGATSVTFGGYPGFEMEEQGPTTIVVTSPPYPSAGLHYIEVTTPEGTSGKVAATGFTYQSAPTVTALSPATGPTSGGTSVTITGTNFLGANSVTFGGYPASNVVVINATIIIVTSPAYPSAGLHYVQVTTPTGTSGKVAAAGFTYT
jgi:hypothetical protein